MIKNTISLKRQSNKLLKHGLGLTRLGRVQRKAPSLFRLLMGRYYRGTITTVKLIDILAVILRSK